MTTSSKKSSHKKITMKLNSNINNLEKYEETKLANEIDINYVFNYKKMKLKFDLESDNITKPILLSIISKLNITKNQEQITDAWISTLKQGNNDDSIDWYDLVKSVTSGEMLNNDNKDIHTFYNKLIYYWLTKTESIILRLIHLQNREWVKANASYSSYISTIIQSLTEGNWYDLEKIDFVNHLQKNPSKQNLDIIAQNSQNPVHIGNHFQQSPNQKPWTNNGLAFLVQYSQIENISQREKDIKSIRNYSNKYSNPFNYSSIHSNASNPGRRNSSNWNSIVSPSIIARLYTQISKIDQFDFDIFDLDDIVGKKATIFVAHEIWAKFDFVDNKIIPMEIMKNFIEEIVKHYDREHAPYHNDLHAGDVMQTLFTIFIKGDLQHKMQLNQLDSFAILIGALCHDFKHTGQNNVFHVNSRSKLAIRYNDKSVLENYHVSQTFKVLSHSHTNIFKTFKPEEFRICRKRIIEGILATDMANHQKVIQNIKAKITSFNIVKGKNFEKLFDINDVTKLFEAQQSIWNMILHSSDISNPGKPAKISENWTKRVYDEFFIQGDLEKEKGLPVSMFCDRETTNINKAMIGFINFVVMPTWDICSTIIYEIVDYKHYCKSNLNKYISLVAKEEKMNQLWGKK